MWNPNVYVPCINNGTSENSMYRYATPSAASSLSIVAVAQPLVHFFDLSDACKNAPKVHLPLRLGLAVGKTLFS